MPFQIDLHLHFTFHERSVISGLSREEEINPFYYFLTGYVLLDTDSSLSRQQRHARWAKDHGHHTHLIRSWTI
jgi:hypothetical protein